VPVPAPAFHRMEVEMPPPPGPVELEARERKFLTALSFGLGISQGCGLCFYVGSGGYFGAVFDDERFFVNACAFFYLPPILVTILQLLLDRHFDMLLGIRPVILFRIYFSIFMVALLLAVIGWVCATQPYPGEGKLVYGLGAVLAVFAAILLGSACLLFGAVDPRFVPYFVLGQTFAGVYTNASARLLGFGPGCSVWKARAFFGLAAASVALGLLAYWCYNRYQLLERTYQHHETLLVYSQSLASIPQDLRILPCGPQREISVAERRGDVKTLGGFPLLCWSMVLCQAVAIAMNMSLTPLAYQVAHGSYDLTQELVLVKLLSDFVGRSGFLLLVPKPTNQPGCRWPSVRSHALAVWLIELLRLPVWVSVYLWAIGSQVPSFLAQTGVLLWLVWLPLISTGALSSSWCFVVAVTAAPEEKRPEVNLLMSFSVYAGFATGIVIALLTR